MRKIRASQIDIKAIKQIICHTFVLLFCYRFVVIFCLSFERKDGQNQEINKKEEIILFF